MLTFHYIPQSKIAQWTSQQRVSHIIELVKKHTIILLEGKLRSTEEALLIRYTMEHITEGFPGIEIATFRDEHAGTGWREYVRQRFFKHHHGLTLIGPASIISELEQHPEYVQMHIKR